MELVPFALFAFKCGAYLVWKIQKQEVLKKLEDGASMADKDFRKLILSEIDKVDLKLSKLSRKDLLASTIFYREGLEHLSQVLNHAGMDGKADTVSADNKSKSSLDTDRVEIVDAINSDLKRLKKTDLDETAQKLILHARKAFDKASTKATEAFSNEILKSSERIQAMSICMLAKILENLEEPSVAMPSCKTLLRELNSLPDVQNTFRRAVSGKGIDAEIFVPVCHLNRIVFDVIQLVSEKKGPWNWPPITSKDGIHQIDPLRDVRVAEALSKLHEKKKETMLLNVTELPVAWSFGTQDAKLISPRNVATNTLGQFIVADNGDLRVKVFDKSAKMVLSFRPLPCHLADEDTFSVASDHEDNIFVLTKIDKYHYKVYLFNKDGHLFHRFILEECLVLCSPIITDDNKLLVLAAARNDPKCCEFQIYNTDGTFTSKSIEEDILEEPKDITVANDGHFMVLNNNGHVIVLDANGNHLSKLDFNHADQSLVEATAFHSESNHVAVSSLESGFRVKISIYDDRRDRVLIIHQGGKDIDENEQKECVPPKIAVAKNGNIAVLTGIVGECEVTVV